MILEMHWGSLALELDICAFGARCTLKMYIYNGMKSPFRLVNGQMQSIGQPTQNI